MKYRRLGNSELMISEISFGCMSLEANFDTTNKLIQLAFDNGINYFDTADLYQKGANESMLGEAVKDFRQQIIIGTKVGNELRKDGSGWDWNPSKEYIKKSVEESLTRLQTDYIDLYQLHGGTIEDPIEETIEAFETLKKEGKIRYYGISSIRPNVIREYVKSSRISSVMMQYSLLDRRAEESCLEVLQENSIGVLARGPLAKGLLAGKPASAYMHYTASEIQKIVRSMASISNSDSDINQTATQFVLRHASVTSAVIGIRTEKQLLAALGTVDVSKLSDSEYEFLKGLCTPELYADHR